MAPLSAIPASSIESASQIDISEETRLAQLRRIEELKTKIGNLPSWLTDRQGSISSFRTIASDKSACESPISSPSTLGNSALHNQDFEAEIPANKNVRSDRGSSIDSGNILQDDRLEIGDISQNGIADEGVDHQAPKRERLSSTANDSEHSQSMGSILSKASEPSSNTSLEIHDGAIKAEHEDSTPLLRVPSEKPPSLNVSSPLSALASTTPTSISSTSPTNNFKRRRLSRESRIQVSQFKPRTAIPLGINAAELARQSIDAAWSSRLNPFVLHPDEYQLLRNHICHLHVTAYLNVRNRILRLWVRNPLVTVTPEEAAGCAYGSKWLGLAQVAYEWLIRRGYINFGCVEVPDPLEEKPKKAKGPEKKVIVIGAGMSGLGCARQLEGLFSHYRDVWTLRGQEPPKIVVLEGRPRIGGRIYSHPLKNQASKRIPKNLRCTTEMGAHIITGFDHGNPMNVIIRGQLALPYYPLRDTSVLYDIDGKIVDGERDKMIEKLFNDILDRASVYRNKQNVPVTVKGDQEMIEAGKDPGGEALKTIAEVEAETNAIMNRPETLNEKGLDQVPAGFDKMTGKAHIVPGLRTKVPGAIAAEAMGFRLASSEVSGKDIDLEAVAKSSEYPTLGAAMDEAVKQYQSIIDLTPKDLRLLNWHYANLEYANAVNVNKLSLGGWDQDIGNEFEGEHAQVIGGYIQVPRGLLRCPWPLDLRTRKSVAHVTYDLCEGSESMARVICEDGEELEASHVVLTAPLGVLKQNSISFEPELPSWKRTSIARLGFGTLNKVILVYEKPFWDVEQDMIGLLRDTENVNTTDQADYAANRGRFYLFWNCIKTSGRPLLIALMAGDAAYQAESMNDGQIIFEVTQQLSNMFKHKHIPFPSETIVTRWGNDRFARGSYSYVGPESHSDDYDAMAKPVANLHFAGEATCGTHPATVHGAYISGLRAASEVLESLIGPIEIPSPLVPTTLAKPEVGIAASSISAKPPSSSGQTRILPTGETLAAKQARLEAFESDILKAIFAKLGPRPDKPGKAGANPFLLFSKDKWAEVKARCDNARRASIGDPEAKASRNEVRAALGVMWREASEEVKRPYLERTVANRASNLDEAAHFYDRLAEWDAEAMATRREYVEQHPGILSKQEEQEMWQALGVFVGVDRKAKRASGYADGESEVVKEKKIHGNKGKGRPKSRLSGEAVKIEPVIKAVDEADTTVVSHVTDVRAGDQDSSMIDAAAPTSPISHTISTSGHAAEAEAEAAAMAGAQSDVDADVDADADVKMADTQ